MKAFRDHHFDPDVCRSELDAFKHLLDSKQDLSETADIRPFFERHKQVAALIGSYNSRIVGLNLLADQFSLFGDFACDLVIGDSKSNAYCFVEFEDGAENSIFRANGAKATREWSPRFEHGFSQIVDWFYKMDDMERTTQFETMFGRGADYSGLLVVGRNIGLKAGERERMQWRKRKVLINSRTVECVTFDDVYTDLDRVLRRYDPSHFAGKI